MWLDNYRDSTFALDIKSEKSKDGKISGMTLNGKTVEAADYKPSEEVRRMTMEWQRNFWYARVVQQTPYGEFNDVSLLRRVQLDQKVFNAWTPPESEDPDMGWMSDAYRPIARNKVISVAAHITKATPFPDIVALNQDSQEDKDAAEVMHDLVTEVALRSDYEQTLLYAVIDALVNPAVILHHEYSKVMRKQKTIQADGSWKTEWVEDEVYSGFRDTLLGCDELFIADPYIPAKDLQRQPYLIWRHVIEYDVAYQIFHSQDIDENGKITPNAFDLHVKPGLMLLFDAQTVLFYRQYDENLRGKLVEHVKCWQRTLDLELDFVNGVLVSDPDQPMRRTDKLYPFAVGGYEPFNHRFFWFCSLIKKLTKDEETLNQMYRMVMDGTYLQLFKPTFIMGEESVDGSVIMPGTVTNLKKDTKVQSYDVGSNLQAGLAAITKLEASISESAASGETSEGGSPPGQQTAQEIAAIEENAKILLQLFAKMLVPFIKQWGTLIVGDILQHMTVGQADELLGEEAQLKFNQFLVHKSVNGRDKSRHIKFSTDVGKIAKRLDTDHKGKHLHFDMMKEEGHEIKHGKLIESDREIAIVDPTAFRKLRFMTILKPDQLLPQSESVERAFNTEEYDRMISNPRADQEEALRLLLSSYRSTRGNPDKYVAKEPPPQPEGIVGPGGGGGKPNAQGVLGKAMSMQKRQGMPAAKGL